MLLPFIWRSEALIIMHKNRFKISFFIIALLCASCVQVGKEMVSWVDAEETEQVFGAYHFLDANGTEIYLPEDFEKYSIASYQKVINKLAAEDQVNNEFNRLNNLNKMKGDFYIFFDEKTNATCTVNTMPYTPLSKREAQQFLGIMRLNAEKSVRNKNISFKKITARYSGTPENCIFKSIYKAEGEKLETFTSSYFITSNNKTIFLQLSTPFEAYFDPFIKKFRM